MKSLISVSISSFVKLGNVAMLEFLVLLVIGAIIVGLIVNSGSASSKIPRPPKVFDPGNNNATKMVFNSSSKFSSQSNKPANFSKDILASPDNLMGRVIKCPNLFPRNPCTGTEGSDKIEGTSTDDFIYGLNGDDTILAYGSIGGPSGYDYVDGGEGADAIYGGADQDAVIGKGGDDMIYGEEGNDGLSGGEGNDHIDGGDGNDQIWGNEGLDIINGGEGNDKIYHDNSLGSALYDYGSPDGYKDIIDCGPGIDDVWINTARDGDITMNCEKVHTNHPKADTEAGNLTTLNKLGTK